MTVKKTFFAFSLVTLAAIMISGIVLFILLNNLVAVETGHFDQMQHHGAMFTYNSPVADQQMAGAAGGDYYVYQKSELIGTFSTYAEALDYAVGFENAAIKQKGMTNLLWNNYAPYNVFLSANEYYEFNSFEEARSFAVAKPQAYIYYRPSNSLIWDNVSDMRQSAFVNNVPLIQQFPELPRGCEVTSLAMLLGYAGIDVDKLVLAEEIIKNTEPYMVKNGIIYAGNPNDGFVGSMTDYSQHGLGVYHRPIYQLMQKYLPDTALDMTGGEFEDLYTLINKGSPVWVIINSKYKALPDSEFVQWVTPAGEIKVTYREHAVVMTGYDEKYIYFNDPLNNKSSAPKADFIAAWEQMGRQAISIIR